MFVKKHSLKFFEMQELAEFIPIAVELNTNDEKNVMIDQREELIGKEIVVYVY
jgi:hypothetical protein